MKTKRKIVRQAGLDKARAMRNVTYYFKEAFRSRTWIFNSYSRASPRRKKCCMF